VRQSLLRCGCNIISAFSFISVLAAPARADLFTFRTRATFNAAAPGLPTETFEAGLVGAGGVTPCTGPLSSASGSSCFSIGALLPGVTLNSSPTVNSNMVVLGANFAGVGNTSKVVGPSLFADTLNIVFSDANAIGFDFFPGTSAGNVLFSLFSPTNVSLGTFTLSGAVASNVFGVISDSALIGRINIATQTASTGELVDNLSFGRTSVSSRPGTGQRCPAPDAASTCRKSASQACGKTLACVKITSALEGTSSKALQ
jgi:hypothetical protein